MQTRTLATTVGLFVAACGPLPPSGGSGESATEGGETTTGMPTTGVPTTGEPETSGSGSGSSSTTEPPPECVDDGDCSFGECSYCIEGSCEYSPGCCGLMPAPDGELQFRCIGYECYTDEECSDGEICESAPGFCSPMAAIPTCERQTLSLSTIDLQAAPNSIGLVDLDGDGALDLVATLPDIGLVEVALGDGAGGFAAGGTFPSKLEPGAHRIAWADFDGDADPDLAISRPVPTGELALLFGQDAVFGDAVLLTLGASPTEVWAGDVDGDGHADLVAHNQDGSAPLTLRLGDGLGGFGEELGGDQLVGEMFVAAAGGFDGEGKLAIVTGVAVGPGIRMLSWVGGGFSASEWPGFHGSLAQERLVTGDVDGDGLTDIAGYRATPDAGLVTLWSVLEAEPQRELAVTGTLQLGPIADVDGDGRGDLVALDADPTLLRVIYTGAEPCVQTFALPQPAAPELLAAGDLDGDGEADVVAGSFAGAGVTILRSGP